MDIKLEIKKILNDLFDFDKGDDDLIYETIDSVRYFKYMLTLEEKFKINLDGKDISSINKTVKIIKNK